MSEDWFWEGNVVAALVAHLTREGWSIRYVADTSLREHGADVTARRGDEHLVVEVKGYPSTVYARGPMQGQPKQARPTAQARHWFSHVVVAAIVRQAEYPGDSVAIALPNFHLYHKLLDKTRHALDKLGITVYIVEQSGLVRTIPPAEQTSP
jgi:hypothetical protein